MNLASNRLWSEILSTAFFSFNNKKKSFGNVLHFKHKRCLKWCVCQALNRTPFSSVTCSVISLTVAGSHVIFLSITWGSPKQRGLVWNYLYYRNNRIVHNYFYTITIISYQTMLRYWQEPQKIPTGEYTKNQSLTLILVFSLSWLIGMWNIIPLSRQDGWICFHRAYNSLFYSLISHRLCFKAVTNDC